MKKRTIFLVIAVFACLICVVIPLITTSSPSLKATATARAISRATATSRPTKIPTSTRILTSTPAPTPMRVELGEAEAKGLVQVDVSGEGLEWIKIILESMIPDPVEVTILPGTVFEAQSAGTQSMVVREKKLAFLRAHDSGELSVPVACANMELGVPGESDKFTISRASVPEDLMKLLTLSDFQTETFRVQQFAVWTVTDNPARDRYVGLGRFGFGSGPEDDEIERIRILFERAGISTDKYHALR